MVGFIVLLFIGRLPEQLLVAYTEIVPTYRTRFGVYLVVGHKRNVAIRLPLDDGFGIESRVLHTN